MNIVEYNRAAWDKQVEQGNQWTTPVSPEVIAAARHGEWSLRLTEQVFVPREWFAVRDHTEPMGMNILCLASGGGQQAPILAAAGAHVTVLDNSPKQLDGDRMVAERDGLTLNLIQGDARNLSMLADQSFDLIFHPVSNCFIPEIRPVWREAYRVLRRGGILLAGFNNPLIYLFSYDALDGKAPLTVKHPLPYSDAADLDKAELDKLIAEGVPLEYSHTLTDQIGGQLDAGFQLVAMYESRHTNMPLSQFTPTYIATRALKPL